MGTGTHAGSGGDDFGFATRTGHRKAMLGSGGGTRQSERAVAGALNWLARHQSARRQLEPGELQGELQGRQLQRRRQNRRL